MAKDHQKEKVTVETLLRIKRDERPGADFWESFESDFQRRRLNALVESSSKRNPFWMPGLRTVAIGLPALLLAVGGLFWTQTDVPSGVQIAVVENVPELVAEGFVAQADPAPVREVEVLPEFDTSVASSQFVVDAIQPSQTKSHNFRKVLYTPAIRLTAPRGASYVRDSMSTSNYRVTTADFKQGRNF
ncbi:MAG: hypothetical protein AB3N63_11925 [Puniceicoccaceae bacterium]